MNRATRDKFASGTGKDATKGNACWETAPAVFRKLSKDFGPFDLDLFADTRRALRPKFFGPGSTRETNALREGLGWHRHGRNGFANPPYGRTVSPALRKARDEARGEGAFTSTWLLPMRVTRAFYAYVLDGAAELLFCDRRLIFWVKGKPRRTRNKKTGKLRKAPDAAMFDSIIVRYVPGHVGPPRIGIWHAPHPKAQAKP